MDLLLMYENDTRITLLYRVSMRFKIKYKMHRCLGHRKLFLTWLTPMWLKVCLSMSPKCEACIPGKQTQTAISKIREGSRAMSPLGCIQYIYGPMFIPSCTGYLYSMNIINNFSFL